jgi:hypothetical protein
MRVYFRRLIEREMSENLQRESACTHALLLNGISFVVRSFVRWCPPFLFFVLYYCTVLLYMCSTGPNRKLSTGRRRDRHHGQREEGSRAPRSRDQVRTQTDLLRSAAT